MIESFFRMLAVRKKNENDLSDMTYAMCRTSDKFQTAFIRFFFEDQIPEEECCSFEIEREYSKGKCRPDFYFLYGDKEYLIENKIFDRQQHFEDYVATFAIPNEQLGYITNYPLSKKGFRTHTWHQFYDYVSRNIPEEESDLWKGYLSYVEKCCNLSISNCPMNIKEMVSVFTFYHSIDGIIPFNNDEFESFVADEAFNRGWSSNRAGGNFQGGPLDGIMGKYFHVSFKDDVIKDTYGWFGVYFSLEDPVICMAFYNYDDCGRPISDRIFACREEEFPEGKLSSDPYYEYLEEGNCSVGAYYFDFLPPEGFPQKNLDEQRAILRDFFEEVMMRIYKSTN